MSKLTLITVGKLKDQSLSNIEQDYLKRITSPKLEIIECKSFEENKEKEAQEVLKKIDSLHHSCKVILLTEKGTLFDSSKFSSWLTQAGNNALVFVIAGAAGPAASLINRANLQLSLSPLTFPHRLARIILVEQLYRAQTIQEGHPYHK